MKDYDTELKRCIAWEASRLGAVGEPKVMFHREMASCVFKHQDGTRRTYNGLTLGDLLERMEREKPITFSKDITEAFGQLRSTD